MKKAIGTNEFIVQYKTSAQISPEDFEVFYPTLKVYHNTTIGEIMEWYKTHRPNVLLDVRLIETQLLEAK